MNTKKDNKDRIWRASLKNEPKQDSCDERRILELCYGIIFNSNYKEDNNRSASNH
jgi:hypothetical protein